MPQQRARPRPAGPRPHATAQLRQADHGSRV